MRRWTASLGTRLWALGLVAFASAALAQEAPLTGLTEYPVAIRCGTCQGQSCDTAAVVAVESSRDLSVGFRTHPEHCSQIRVDISVDGRPVLSSGFLSAGQSTGLVEVGPVTPGRHIVTVNAVGMEGGCNMGDLCTWGGFVQVDTECKSCSVCRDEPPPIRVTPGVELKTEAADCGLRPGKFGAAVELSVSGEAVGPTCANQCQGQTSGTVNGTVTLHACERSVPIGFSGQSTSKVEYCKGCDALTCREGCDPDKSCATNEWSATPSVGAQLTLDVPVAQKSLSKLGIDAKCEATFGVGVSVTASGKTSVNNNFCRECQNCSQSSLTLNGTGTASATCSARVELLGETLNIGCDRCGELTVSMSGGHMKQSGDCGTKDCYTAGFSIQGIVQTPAVCLKTRFGRGVSVRYQGGVSWSSSTDTCSSGSPPVSLPVFSGALVPTAFARCEG